jgi:hypothetical protein
MQVQVLKGTARITGGSKGAAYDREAGQIQRKEAKALLHQLIKLLDSITGGWRT